MVLPKDIVDYQHFELTSREKCVSIFQERSFNTDNIYLTFHLEKKFGTIFNLGLDFYRIIFCNFAFGLLPFLVR